MADANSVTATGTVAAKGEHEFVRAIGLFDGTMIVVGSMIGSGIFLVAADIARQTGSAGGLPLYWILTGWLTNAAAPSSSGMAVMVSQRGRPNVEFRVTDLQRWGIF